MTTKSGPNDASGIVWALGGALFFISTRFSLVIFHFTNKIFRYLFDLLTTTTIRKGRRQRGRRGARDWSLVCVFLLCFSFFTVLLTNDYLKAFILCYYCDDGRERKGSCRRRRRGPETQLHLEPLGTLYFFSFYFYYWLSRHQRGPPRRHHHHHHYNCYLNHDDEANEEVDAEDDEDDDWGSRPSFFSVFYIFYNYATLTPLSTSSLCFDTTKKGPKRRSCLLGPR
jgi:hypothetical protein